MDDQTKPFYKSVSVEKEEEKLQAGLTTCMHIVHNTATQLPTTCQFCSLNHTTRVMRRYVTLQNDAVHRVTERIALRGTDFL